jgi:hypothetical protein
MEGTATLGREKSVLISPLMEALDRRKLFLSVPKDHGEPLTAYAVLHRRTSRAIVAALDTFDAWQKKRMDEGYSPEMSGTPAPAMDAFLDAVYRVAELFEFYQADIPRYVASLPHNRLSKQYQGQLKALSKPCGSHYATAASIIMLL